MTMNMVIDTRVYRRLCRFRNADDIADFKLFKVSDLRSTDNEAI